MSGKRGRGRPRLTFENTVSKILKENVKSMRIPRWACMKRLTTVDEAKRYVVFGASFSLTTSLGVKLEANYSYSY